MPYTNFKTTEEFDEILKQSELNYVFVYFSGEGCQPCKKLAPYFDEYTESFNETFYKYEQPLGVKVADSPKEKANVEAVPTFVLYEGGLEIGRLLTNNPLQLKAWINLHVQPPAEIEAPAPAKAVPVCDGDVCHL